MKNEEILGKIECLLFAAGDSMPILGIAELLEEDATKIEELIDEDIARREKSGGLIIKKFDDRIQLATPLAHGALLSKAFGKKSEEELTRAMIETLSIIAYKQPVTRAEIEELRGVNTSYMLSSLQDRKLIVEAGRKDAVGRPIMYATAEGFLRHFGLSTLEELPPVADEVEEELQELEY